MPPERLSAREGHFDLTDEFLPRNIPWPICKAGFLSELLGWPKPLATPRHLRQHKKSLKGHVVNLVIYDVRRVIMRQRGMRVTRPAALQLAFNEGQSWMGEV